MVGSAAVAELVAPTAPVVRAIVGLSTIGLADATPAGAFTLPAAVIVGSFAVPVPVTSVGVTVTAEDPSFVVVEAVAPESFAPIPMTGPFALPEITTSAGVIITAELASPAAPESVAPVPFTVSATDASLAEPLAEATSAGAFVFAPVVTVASFAVPVAVTSAGVIDTARLASPAAPERVAPVSFTARATAESLAEPVAEATPVAEIIGSFAVPVAVA
jgi:hypothetical protein